MTKKQKRQMEELRLKARAAARSASELERLGFREEAWKMKATAIACVDARRRMRRGSCAVDGVTVIWRDKPEAEELKAEELVFGC